MNDADRARASREQLNLVLSFFPRVETKLSVVLACDLALLGFVAAHLPNIALVQTRSWISLGIFAFLNGCSLWRLYQGSFPQLVGGAQSLVYFYEISKRTESAFIDEFSALSDVTLTKQLLGQAWRNSQILSQKFDHLTWAYRLMAVSVVPWAVSLLFVAR